MWTKLLYTLHNMYCQYFAEKMIKQKFVIKVSHKSSFVSKIPSKHRNFTKNLKTLRGRKKSTNKHRTVLKSSARPARAGCSELVTDRSSVLPFCPNRTEQVNQSSVSRTKTEPNRICKKSIKNQT